MRYVELRYEVAAADAELAANALVEAGASGIEVRDGSTIERPTPDHVVLVSWIAPDEVDAFVSRATSRLGSIRATLVRDERDEDEWRDAWKKYFHARPIGRFVIVPSWETYAKKDGEIVLDLDPGRAFGTGGHASTRLCLRAIDEMTSDVKTILDVGCGSGVLAIAALKRWTSATAIGVDVDEDALEVSRENAERNGVGARARFLIASVDMATKHDLVLANIQPEVLIPAAKRLRSHVVDSGTLVLAGIIDDAAKSVVDAFVAEGLPAPRTLDEEGWTALVFGAAR